LRFFLISLQKYGLNLLQKSKEIHAGNKFDEYNGMEELDF
jgi:hypothetical protein